MAIVLAGCSVGPAYKRPATTIPPAWRTATGMPVWPSTDWWHGFNSPVLDSDLIRAEANNNDLAAAIARVDEADAQVRIAGAALLPSVDMDASVTHERAAAAGLGLRTGTVYNPALNASYEIDFWGKNRAAKAAAQATALASRYDRDTVELTIVASVATTYFQALEVRERLDIAEHNLASAETTLSGLRLQETAGIATALDVAQQDTVVATLNAAIPPLQEQLSQTIDALAILLGQPPESVHIDGGALAELSLPRVAPGLPSTLLARRPDVAEAEAQLIAANADITVARAAFFPSIQLTAAGGFESKALSTLLNPENAVFSLAAGLTQPIFEGGALQGQYAYSQARYAELVADYRKAVLTAFGNVEDALAAVQQTDDQLSRQETATAAARRAYEISQAQLRAGTISILTVLNTETALFTAEDSLVQVRFSRLQALINLFSALGGGWRQT